MQGLCTPDFSLASLPPDVILVANRRMFSSGLWLLLVTSTESQEVGRLCVHTQVTTAPNAITTWAESGGHFPSAYPVPRWGCVLVADWHLGIQPTHSHRPVVLLLPFPQPPVYWTRSRKFKFQVYFYLRSLGATLPITETAQ